MIDWHCHILPGLDDGPESMVESLAMARLLANTGFRIVHCTPHCFHGRYDTPPEQVRRLTERLQLNLLGLGIPLLVKPGMEYHLDGNFPAKLDDLLPLGESSLLLVEIPFKAGVELVLENVNLILQRGLTPLLAHPERCPLLSDSLRRKGDGVFKGRMKQLFGSRFNALPGELTSSADLRLGLGEMGCLFQGNIGSFAGMYGSGVRQAALGHLESGLYSRLGSDGHGYRSLQMGLGSGLSLIEEYPAGVFLLENPMPTGVTLKINQQPKLQERPGCPPN